MFVFKCRQITLAISEMGGGRVVRSKQNREFSNTFFIAMIIMLSVLYMEAPKRSHCWVRLAILLSRIATCRVLLPQTFHATFLDVA